MSELPPVVERFLRYVQIDTQSDPDSDTYPSTEKQKDLGRLLFEELRALGVQDAFMDEYGYVFGTIPGRGASKSAPTVGLLAHVDTSSEEPGGPVHPIVHPPYEGGVITLPGDSSVRLDPARQPALLKHVGERIITSDGTTLLGSDDKAGVAVLMQLAEDLLAAEWSVHPSIRLCFTIDEEIGRGVDKLDLQRFGAPVAYTLDGSGIDTIESETFNAAEATVSIKGLQVHPGYAKDVMVNALRIAAELITILPAAEAPETTSGREGYIHPHGFKGHDASFAEVKLILRDFTEEGLDRRKALVESAVAYLRTKYPKAGIEAKIKDQYKNMRSYIEEKDARAIEFAFAAGREMGIELLSEAIRGGTDGARLSEMGIPTPNVFNGGYDYHSRFEWNTVENLERTLAYTKELLRYWALNG